MGNIWITSDLHFCHDRDFVVAKRGFRTVEEMNEGIVIRWNGRVTKNDTVYVLGDLMLMNNTRGLELIKSLNGKLRVVVGNHDSDNRLQLYEECPNVESIEYAYRMNYEGINFFLTHYPTLTAEKDPTIPLFKTVINLCGHSHTQFPFVDWGKGRIYHCEMDAHNCYPVNMEKVFEEIKKRYEGDLA